MTDKERLWSVFYAKRERLRSYASRHAISLTLAGVLLVLTWGWILIVGLYT